MPSFKQYFTFKRSLLRPPRNERKEREWLHAVLLRISLERGHGTYFILNIVHVHVERYKKRVRQRENNEIF